MTDEKKELVIEDELDTIADDLVEEISQPTEEEVKDMMKSVEVKKRGPKKKDIPTPSEESVLTEKEAINTLDSKTKDLFMEFNSFIEDKADIKQDTGVKVVIPTGIDVLDAFMGGGFAVELLVLLLANQEAVSRWLLFRQLVHHRENLREIVWQHILTRKRQQQQ